MSDPNPVSPSVPTANPATGNQAAHLRTKFVFVDTQALRKERFDWKGRSLSKIVEFAKHGHLRLLVTPVVVGEVKSQLREVLAEARGALVKHAGILGQLGASTAVENVRDEAAALKTLESAFDQFLRDVRAKEVPLIADVSSVLRDYFERRPPFSAKKKSEFPDAISLASIRHWCEQTRVTAYVVSSDPDLKACCSDDGPLFHADSIAEIISQTTVSREFHTALETALRGSEHLSDSLADQIKALDVEVRLSSHSPRQIRVERASIDDVHSINILSVNVLEQNEDLFTCEVEVEAELSLDLDIEVESRYGYGPNDYEPSRWHSIQRTAVEYFYSEVIVKFDASSGSLDFESIWVGGNPLKVELDDLGRDFR